MKYTEIHGITMSGWAVRLNDKSWISWHDYWVFEITTRLRRARVVDEEEADYLARRSGGEKVFVRRKGGNFYTVDGFVGENGVIHNPEIS